MPLFLNSIGRHGDSTVWAGSDDPAFFLIESPSHALFLNCINKCHSLFLNRFYVVSGIHWHRQK